MQNNFGSDLKNIKDRVKVIWKSNKTNKYLDISSIVSKKTWEGDYKSSGRKATIEVVNAYEDKNIPKADIQLGDVVRFFIDNKLLFCGNVKNINKSSDSNTFTYTVFDIGHRLLTKDTKIYQGKKAEDIAKDILTAHKMSVGTFAKTNKTMDKFFQGNSLYEMIMIAYTEASKSTKKKYMLAIQDDKIHVIEKGLNILKIEFQEGKNIISSSFDASIENMVNKLIVKDDKGNVKTTKEKKDWIKLYGVMQDVIQINQNDKNENETIEKAFKNVERNCRLTGFGDITTITGTAVYVTDKKTGLVGKFYIDSDKHTFEKGLHKIELTLNFENIMDERTGGEKQEKEGSSGSGGYSVTKGGWREVPAEFTAY